MVGCVQVGTGHEVVLKLKDLCECTHVRAAIFPSSPPTFLMITLPSTNPPSPALPCGGSQTECMDGASVKGKRMDEIETCVFNYLEP